MEPSPSIAASRPVDSQRDALADTLLAGYRGTIDDEGEDLHDARVAIDHYLAVIERDHSFVVLDGVNVIALSFVLFVDELPYIDPVVVAPAWKRQGLGSEAVRLCLGSLLRSGHTEVGATITDGNIASEGLFTGLGFTRRGAWP